ncbi:vancomycin high temperature exclusion protein [compost metagenome]
MELYRAGKVKFILVSGDNSNKTYDEPTDMKNALIAAGIPASRIYLDYAGFRTLDSMERALKVFGQKEVIVVSQRFHNERAIYLGEHFGMTVYGYNAQDVAKMGGFKTKTRERFARMKVFWDILFGVDSKFLGTPVNIR